jgi:hypothetical protein
MNSIPPRSMYPPVLASKEVMYSLHEEFSSTRNVPGLHGIACLKRAFEQENLDGKTHPFLRTRLSLSNHCWPHENAMFNSLWKTTLVTRTATVQVLFDVLYSYINSSPMTCGSRTPGVLAEYLKENVHTRFEGDEVELLLEGTFLIQIENIHGCKIISEIVYFNDSNFAKWAWIYLAVM